MKDKMLVVYIMIFLEIWIRICNFASCQPDFIFHELHKSDCYGEHIEKEFVSLSLEYKMIPLKYCVQFITQFIIQDSFKLGSPN